MSVVSFLSIVLALSSPALAEIAYFANGRSMSIKGHHEEGSMLVLTLRGGGQIVTEPSAIAQFAPDEVPYPEPEEASANVNASSTDRSAGLQPDLYGAIIDRVAKEQNVDARLVRAVIQVESAYRSTARSRKGAMGLMQLMPETARQYAVADPYDPASNIEAGIKHLKGLLQRLPLELALAAYNAGEAAVQKFRGIPPYAETRDYVSRILRLVRQ